MIFGLQLIMVVINQYSFKLEDVVMDIDVIKNIYFDIECYFFKKFIIEFEN